MTGSTMNKDMGLIGIIPIHGSTGDVRGSSGVDHTDVFRVQF